MYFLWKTGVPFLIDLIINFGKPYRRDIGWSKFDHYISRILGLCVFLIVFSLLALLTADFGIIVPIVILSIIEFFEICFLGTRGLWAYLYYKKAHKENALVPVDFWKDDKSY